MSGIKTILGTVHSEKCDLCGQPVMPWRATITPDDRIICADVKKCMNTIEQKGGMNP